MVSRIRIPVYQSKSISLTDIVTEMSLYTTLVDPDTLLDTDLNDIADDDFVTSST